MVELKSTADKTRPTKTDKTESEEPKDQPEQVAQDYKQLAEDYKDLLQRLQAEFENYKKRIEKEKQELFAIAKHSLIKKLLDTYDDFERMLQHVHDQESKHALEMIFKNFKKVLEEEGVRPIESKGKKLDPYKHEVMTQVEGEDDDIIVDEFQKGYMLHNHVLRTSKVMISKKP